MTRGRTLTTKHGLTMGALVHPLDGRTGELALTQLTMRTLDPLGCRLHELTMLGAHDFTAVNSWGLTYAPWATTTAG